MIRVAKFGGTSMGSAEAMRQAAALVKERGFGFTVVSATSGTTNQLLQAHRARNTDGFHDAFGAICYRHNEMAAALEASAQTRLALEKIYNEMREMRLADSDEILDAWIAFGERLSSVLFADALRQAGLPAATADARQILRTDARFGRAEPEISSTRISAAPFRKRMERGSSS